jgi:hypothetical protein
MFPILESSEICECGALPDNHAHDYTRAIINTRPVCDLCATNNRVTLAEYDAKISSANAWAYVCGEHFISELCTTGLGLGQELITPTTIKEN